MLDINKRSMLDRSSAEIERSQTKPAIIEELLSVVCRLPLEQALADDLLLPANLDLVHEGDGVFSLVALQQDDFIVFLVFDNGSVTLEVLAHVPNSETHNIMSTRLSGNHFADAQRNHTIRTLTSRSS